MLTTTGRSMFHITIFSHLIPFWIVFFRLPDFLNRILVYFFFFFFYFINAWKYLGSNARTDSHNAPLMLCLKRKADISLSGKELTTVYVKYSELIKNRFHTFPWQ